MYQHEQIKYLLNANADEQHVVVGGTPRPLGGCLVRRTKFGEGKFPIIATSIAKPRSQWVKTGLTTRVKHIYDQNGYNSCCANMVAQSSLIIASIRGNPSVILSPASIYKKINGGRDAGAAIEDGLDCIANWGALPVNLYDVNDWRKPYPASADQVAAEFKDTEWMDVPDVNVAGTILSAGFPVCVGVYWGRGGHAICLTEVEPASGGEFTDNGTIDFLFANSWGTSYGDNGIGKLPESQVAEGIKAFGAWAPSSVLLH
jgi:hypothetical protein